jgi:hypothetical protein
MISSGSFFCALYASKFLKIVIFVVRVSILKS